MTKTALNAYAKETGHIIYYKTPHLFELMLYIPVNSHGHVGILSPFYGTFNQNEDVMTSNKCLKYNHPIKPQKAYKYEWFDINYFFWAGSGQSVVYNLCLKAQAAHLFL